MFRKHISLIVALIAAAATVSCGAEFAFAQDAGIPPVSDSVGSVAPLPPLPPHPPLPPQPPVTTDGGTDVRQPYPVSEGAQGGTMMPPPQMQRSNEQQPMQWNGEKPPFVKPQDKRPLQPMPYGKDPSTPGGSNDGEERIYNEGNPQMMERKNIKYSPEANREEFEGKGMGPSGDFGGSWGPQGGEGEDEDRMEQQEKMMQKQRLSQMQQNVKRMEQSVKQLTTVIARLKKKNIAVPAEAESLVTELSQATAAVKGASEFTDDVEAAMETLQDKGQDMGEWMQKLGMIEQWTRNVTQVEKQVKKIGDNFAKAKKKKDAAQYQSVITKIEGEVSAMQAKWQEVKDLASAGDIENAVDEMNDLREAMGEVDRSVGFLGQLSSVAKMITNATKEITAFEKSVAKMEKKGVNVSTVRQYITDARTKLTQLKALGSNSEAEADDFFSLMEEIGGIRQNAVEEFEKLNGKPANSALGASVFQALEWRRMGF